MFSYKYNRFIMPHCFLYWCHKWTEPKAVWDIDQKITVEECELAGCRIDTRDAMRIYKNRLCVIWQNIYASSFMIAARLEALIRTISKLCSFERWNNSFIFKFDRYYVQTLFLFSLSAFFFVGVCSLELYNGLELTWRNLRVNQ